MTAALFVSSAFWRSNSITSWPRLAARLAVGSSARGRHYPTHLGLAGETRYMHETVPRVQHDSSWPWSPCGSSAVTRGIRAII